MFTFTVPPTMVLLFWIKPRRQICMEEEEVEEWISTH